jgi:hypothetical protein
VADLNLDMAYPANKKTRLLLRTLGKRADAIPVRLWCYVGKNHPGTGDLIGYSDDELAIVLGERPVKKIIAALIEVGFLEVVDGGYHVHDWEDRAGHLKVFHERAREAAHSRWKKHRASNATSKPTSTASSSPPSNASRNAPVLSGPVLSGPPLPPQGFLKSTGNGTGAGEEIPPVPVRGGRWDKLREALHGAMDEREWENWLRGEERPGTPFIVEFPAPVFLEYLPSAYGDVIRRYLTEPLTLCCHGASVVIETRKGA